MSPQGSSVPWHYRQPFADKARAYGWQVVTVDSGHDCHVERPRELANVLLSRSVKQSERIESIGEYDGAFG